MLLFFVFDHLFLKRFIVFQITEGSVFFLMLSQKFLNNSFLIFLNPLLALASHFLKFMKFSQEQKFLNFLSASFLLLINFSHSLYHHGQGK